MADIKNLRADLLDEVRKVVLTSDEFDDAWMDALPATVVTMVVSKTLDLALPLIEASARSRIESEILEAARNPTLTADHAQAYRHAARIARGEES